MTYLANHIISNPWCACFSNVNLKIIISMLKYNILIFLFLLLWIHFHVFTFLYKFYNKCYLEFICKASKNNLYNLLLEKKIIKPRRSV